MSTTEQAITRPPLWQHQREDLPKLFELIDQHGGAMLEYAMGGGKSRMVIETVLHYKPQRILVVATKTAAESAWAEQCSLWLPAKYELLELAAKSGPQRIKQIQRKLTTRKPLFVVINYQAFINEELAELIHSTKWGLLVLDESHHIKSNDGRIANTIQRGARKGVYLRRLALTGTPMPHSPLDIFQQYLVLVPQVFGSSWTVFKHRYYTWRKLRSNTKVQVPHEFIRREEFSARQRSISIKREFDEYVESEVPVMKAKALQINLGEPVRRMIRQLDVNKICEVPAPLRGAQGGNIYCENILTARLRQLMLTSGIAALKAKEGATRDVIVDTSKLLMLKQLLNKVVDERVVVFAMWTLDIHQINALVKAVLKRPCMVINGETGGQRAELIEAWRDTTNGVIVVQSSAGAEGIDLTAARIAISYSRGYSYGELKQCQHRIYRPGQKKATHFYFIVSNTLIEQAQMASVKARANTLAELNAIYMELLKAKQAEAAK